MKFEYIQTYPRSSQPNNVYRNVIEIGFSPDGELERSLLAALSSSRKTVTIDSTGIHLMLETK